MKNFNLLNELNVINKKGQITQKYKTKIKASLERSSGHEKKTWTLVQKLWMFSWGIVSIIMTT